MIETVSSPDLRYLSPSQRRCRFDDEPLTKEVPFYSTSICYVMCRYRLALELCGCKPFFYHFLGIFNEKNSLMYWTHPNIGGKFKYNKRLLYFLAGKVCDIKGLLCLSEHADKLTEPPVQLGCKCPQPCDMIIYLPQNPKYTKW